MVVKIMDTGNKIKLIALLASLSWASHAADFNYNYGQVSYETGDFEGLVLTGSFEINKDMFIIARYVDTTNDEYGIDIDYSEVSVGAGYHMPVDPKTDAVFSVSFDSGEAEALISGIPVSDDDTGVLLTAGIRHSLNPQIELAGGIYHISTFDGDTGIQGEVRYNINNEMSAGLSYLSGDYLDGFGLNFRLGF